MALGFASAFVEDFRADGTATLDLRIGGTLDDPDLSGLLQVEGGRLRWLRFPQTVEQVMEDREVAFPLTRTMCAPTGDGSAEVIVCSEAI